jgi:hypothetical protein
MSKTIKEIMDELDVSYSSFIDAVDSALRTALKYSRDRVYDVVVYFGYSVMLIKHFGVDSEVIIPKDIVDQGNQGKRYRIDQVSNDDGSLTIKLVEIKDDE